MTGPQDVKGMTVWVNGMVAARDAKPYVQFASDTGMGGQLTISQARQVATDILQAAARAEADAMLLKFFRQMDFPEPTYAALLLEFRDYRHALDQQDTGRAADPEAPRP